LDVDTPAIETPSQYFKGAVMSMVAFDFPFHCDGEGGGIAADVVTAAADVVTAAAAAFAAAFFALFPVMACWICERFKQ
jgi:hypothetical protein